MMRVRAETPCRPTEDPEKVGTAIRNLFPDAVVEHRGDRIVGTSDRLEHLRERIRIQKIRDTARKQLLAGRSGNVARVRLSKQAAFVGVVNFSAESPLGDIDVEIEADDLTAVIDYVAESTLARSD